MNNTIKKTLWILTRIAITLSVWGVGIYLLYTYEYLSQITVLDNFVGIIPIAFIVIFAGCFSLILWMKHNKRHAALSISLAMVVVFSAALFPNALRGNWWIPHDATELAETYPDLSVYEPFKNNEKVARLEQASTLSLSKDFPVLDGSLALYPLYSAFAEATYENTAQANESVIFTDTVEAWEKLIIGERDIIFSAYGSAKQLERAKNANVDLHFTEIGKEAFVFLVGKNNPINNITYQQIRNIYSGKTKRWNTLGWKEGGNIVAFQRPEGSGSQTGLQKIMGDLPIQAPQPLPDKSLLGTNSLMQQISVEWKGVQPAIGYSYRYFSNTMYPNPDAKILKINNVAPSLENIKNGSYPFVASFYAVTRGNPQGNTKKLIDWILSPQGQKLIEKTGYTPIK